MTPAPASPTCTSRAGSARRSTCRTSASHGARCRTCGSTRTTCPARTWHVDYDYLQKYYEPTNERFLELKADEGLSYFTSRTLVVRQHVTETGYCFVCTDADDGAEQRAARIEQIGRLAEQRVTDWLAMVDEAEAVPTSAGAALAERDLHVRRLIAETDPANVLGERYYGEELTARLVGALCGVPSASTDRPGT